MSSVNSAMTDPFSPDVDRRIFSVFHQSRPLRYDPAVLSRRLNRAEREHGVTYNGLREASARLVEAMRETTTPDHQIEAERIAEGYAKLGYATFDVKPIAEDPAHGWTEAEVMQRLQEYVRWEAEIRGKPDGWQPSSTPTAGPLASSSTTPPTGA